MDWLKLSENTTGARYFVDENGKPVNLFGMARCQGCCETERRHYGGVDGVAEHYKELGCNIIRLAIYIRGDTHERGDMPVEDLIEMCGGYNVEGVNKFIDKYVDPDVQAIKSHGLYIQLDLHDYPPTDVDTKIVEFARNNYILIWRELAKRYKDDPQIAVFEIWNEPYPADCATALKDTPEWVKGIREFFFEAVAAIREIDQRHIIMVSDYNAGWGKAWDICWKDYVNELDSEYKNTCFSIHIGYQQLDVEAPHYMNWILKRMSEENVCMYLGEVETEPGLQSVSGTEHLISSIVNNESTHHLAAVLWRPHTDERNYVKYWTNQMKEYTAK